MPKFKVGDIINCIGYKPKKYKIVLVTNISYSLLCPLILVIIPIEILIQKE